MSIKSTKMQDADLYLVVADDKEVATFRWWDASRAKPASGKHMDLSFYPETMDRVFETPTGVQDILLPIYSHVFHEVLRLTHQLSSEHMCKIHSSDMATKFIYSHFAVQLGEEYTVKMHGNWIYIAKRAEAEDV